MNLLHLKYALEVERTGSITEAAENLYLSQPSLSKAIRELEAMVGIPIFERTSRGVIPTQKGRALLEHARLILKQVSEIESLSIDEHLGHQMLHISIPPCGYLSEAVARFASSLDSRKPMSLKIEETDTLHAVRHVTEGSSRLGVIRYPLAEAQYYADYLKKKGLKSEIIWEFEPVLLLSQQSPIADRPALCEADLNGLTEVARGERRMPFLPEAAPVAVDHQKLLACDRACQWELLSVLAYTYLWDAPTPVDPLRRYALIQRRCQRENAVQRDALIFSDDYRFNEYDRRFIDHLFEVKNHLAFAAID